MKEHLCLTEVEWLLPSLTWNLCEFLLPESAKRDTGREEEERDGSESCARRERGKIEKSWKHKSFQKNYFVSCECFTLFKEPVFQLKC